MEGHFDGGSEEASARCGGSRRRIRDARRAHEQDEQARVVRAHRVHLLVRHGEGSDVERAGEEGIRGTQRESSMTYYQEAFPASEADAICRAIQSVKDFPDC